MKTKKKPNKKQIGQQIVGLEKMKKRLPRRNIFGSANHSGIDAQIAVLKGIKKADDYFQDDTAEEYTDGDNDVWSDASRAEDWLAGSETENLYE